MQSIAFDGLWVTTAEHTCNYRVNEEMHLEWIPEDVEFWADITSIPSFAEFVNHDSVY